MSRKQVAASGERALIEKPAYRLIAKPDGGALGAAAQDGSARIERIREAAYRLYEARGHEHGHDLEDWLAAEASLSAKPAPASNQSAAALAAG